MSASELVLLAHKLASVRCCLVRVAICESAPCGPRRLQIHRVPDEPAFTFRS
jgi:hypothetical protein